MDREYLKQRPEAVKNISIYFANDCFVSFIILGIVSANTLLVSANNFLVFGVVRVMKLSLC